MRVGLTDEIKRSQFACAARVDGNCTSPRNPANSEDAGPPMVAGEGEGEGAGADANIDP